MTSSRSVIVVLLIICGIANRETVADEPAAGDNSQYILPWGPNAWPDEIDVPYPPKGPREGTRLGAIPGIMPTSVECFRYRYSDTFSGSFKDESGLLFKGSRTFTFSPRVSAVHGETFAVHGQVYKYQIGAKRTVVRLKEHPSNVPLKDAVGLFTMNGYLNVGGVEFKRCIEHELRSGKETRHDRFPKIEITVSNLEHRILSPPSDDGRRFEGKSLMTGEIVSTGQVTTLKVDDIIETTYFKFKVHSIVMPDEKEQIRGWINFKLIESKPVTK